MQLWSIVTVLLMVVCRGTAASLSARQALDEDSRVQAWNSQEEELTNDDVLKTPSKWNDGVIYDGFLLDHKKVPIHLSSTAGDVYLTLLRPLPKKWRRGRPMFESKDQPGSPSVNYASFEPFVEPIRMDNLEIFGERYGPFSGSRRMLH